MVAFKLIMFGTGMLFAIAGLPTLGGALIFGVCAGTVFDGLERMCKGRGR